MIQVTVIPRVFDHHPDDRRVIARHVVHQWTDARTVKGVTTWLDPSGGEWQEEWTFDRGDIVVTKGLALTAKLTAMLTILEAMPNTHAKRDLVILTAECGEILEA